MGCRAGSVAVEFALIIPVALAILVGIVEVGRAWRHRSGPFSLDGASAPSPHTSDAAGALPDGEDGETGGGRLG